jgi:hypothetical protein
MLRGLVLKCLVVLVGPLACITITPNAHPTAASVKVYVDPQMAVNQALTPGTTTLNISRVIFISQKHDSST